jgi:hypothetical protein
LSRWEVAEAGPQATRSDLRFVERSRTGLVAVLGAVPARAQVEALQAGRNEAARLTRDLSADANPVVAGAELARFIRAAAVPDDEQMTVTVAVILPGQCGLVTTDAGSGVVLTADGHSYRPRLSRGRPVADSLGPLAQIQLPSDQATAVLLAAPSPAPLPTPGQRPAALLTSLARESLQWPSLQLGVQNHVRSSQQHGTGLIACVNRSALTRRLREAAASDSLAPMIGEPRGRFDG